MFSEAFVGFLILPARSLFRDANCWFADRHVRQLVAEIVKIRCACSVGRLNVTCLHDKLKHVEHLPLAENLPAIRKLTVCVTMNPQCRHQKKIKPNLQCYLIAHSS